MWFDEIRNDRVMLIGFEALSVNSRKVEFVVEIVLVYPVCAMLMFIEIYLYRKEI